MTYDSDEGRVYYALLYEYMHYLLKCHVIIHCYNRHYTVAMFITHL